MGPLKDRAFGPYERLPIPDWRRGRVREKMGSAAVDERHAGRGVFVACWFVFALGSKKGFRFFEAD